MTWIQGMLPTIPPRALIFFSVAAGGLIALALPPYAIPGFVFVALVPFLLLLYLAVPSESRRFLYGWLAGFAALGPTFRWALDAPPLTWLGITSVSVSYLLAVVALGLLAAFLALSYGAFLVLARKLLVGNLWDALTLGFLWAAVEYFRTFAYSFYPLTFGTGSLVGDHLGFGLLGYGLADFDAVRQLSTLIGIYGLGFIVVAVNVLVLFVLKTMAHYGKGSIPYGVFARRLLRIGAVTALVTLFIVGGGGWLKSQFLSYSKSIKVAVVQGNSQNAKGELIYELIPSVAQQSPDIIVVPEGENLFSSPRPTAREVKQLFRDERYHLVLGSIYENKENRIAVYDTATGYLSAYAKRFIMPHAEYVPYATAYIVKSLGGAEWLKTRPRTIPGTQPAVHKTGWGTITTLVCMEVLSPQLVRDAARAGGEILFYSSNVSVIRGSPAYHKEIRAMATIWATATRRFLAYSSQDEPSFLIDPHGELLWESPDMEPRIQVVAASLNRAQTPYVRYPYGFLMIGGVYLVSASALRKRKAGAQPNVLSRENVPGV